MPGKNSPSQSSEAASPHLASMSAGQVSCAAICKEQPNQNQNRIKFIDQITMSINHSKNTTKLAIAHRSRQAEGRYHQQDQELRALHHTERSLQLKQNKCMHRLAIRGSNLQARNVKSSIRGPNFHLVSVRTLDLRRGSTESPILLQIKSLLELELPVLHRAPKM